MTPAGITTYSVMGASTGLTLLWILPITIVILAIVQEMAARLGVVTGQGLSDLIRDRFGVRPTAFAMSSVLVANVANTVAEFSGAAAALEIFGISRYLVVPIVGVAIWALVINGQLPDRRACLPDRHPRVRRVHRVGRAGRPRLGRGSAACSSRRRSTSPGRLAPARRVIGTTITPYMQFYLTSAVAEKGIGADDLRLEQADAVPAGLLTNVIAIFIVVAAPRPRSASGRRDHHLGRRCGEGPGTGRRTPAEALFAVGLFGASVPGRDVMPPRPRSRSARRSAGNRASTSGSRSARSFFALSPSCSSPDAGRPDPGPAAAP